MIEFNGFVSGSSDTCNQGGTVGATTNRYCGMFLNTVVNGNNIAICDCTSPFSVDIFTDAVDDNTGTANTISRSRGETRPELRGFELITPNLILFLQACVWNTPRFPVQINQAFSSLQY